MPEDRKNSGRRIIRSLSWTSENSICKTPRPRGFWNLFSSRMIKRPRSSKNWKKISGTKPRKPDTQWEAKNHTTRNRSLDRDQIWTCPTIKRRAVLAPNPRWTPFSATPSWKKRPIYPTSRPEHPKRERNQPKLIPEGLEVNSCPVIIRCLASTRVWYLLRM